jgi:FkbM family methyltransferase
MPVVIDAGCSYEADFSLLMIKKYGAKAYAIDPTRKHATCLERLAENHSGRFVFLPLAVAASDGILTFHESKSNESGSLMNDHKNMREGEITSYQVKAVTLPTLLSTIGEKKIDILKLDIEGAEYDLLKSVTKDDLQPFVQIFIEFHHHAIPRYSVEETKRLEKKICGYGFSSFSLDDHNYLFWRN